MFDIGIGEIFVILVVALLVFGPERLPTMAKQVASFVRDLRAMVANARRDLSDSVGDLGIDEEDLRTLSDLRNPQSFVRKKVLDGVDLGIDDLGLDDDTTKNGSTKNGSAKNGSAKNGSAKNGSSRNGSTKKGAAAKGSGSTSSSAKGSTTRSGTQSSSPNGSAADSASGPAASDEAVGAADEPDTAAGRNTTPAFDPDAT